MLRPLVLTLAVPVLLSVPACRSAHTTSGPALKGPDASAAATTTNDVQVGNDPSILSLSFDHDGETEPTLAVTADGRLAIAWMGAGADHAAIGVRFSSDGGTTWTPAQSVHSPEQRTATDPVLAPDLGGNIYLAWLANGPDEPGGVPDSHVYVARAEARTSVFGPAIDLSERMYRGSKLAKPWLASTANGAVVATWSYASSVGDGIGTARTVDGKAWAKESVIERIGLHASLPFVCASAHGDRVWVAYLDPEAGVRVHASDDGGISWSAGRGATASAAEERTRIAAQAPVCAGDAEEVTIAYGLTRDPQSPSAETIAVVKSYDGGRVFDSRRLLDAGGAALMNPQLAREYDGALDLAFYAAGATPSAGALHWVRAEGDRSPLAPSHVVRAGFDFEPSRTQRAWPGDYFGWAWRAGALYAASVDNTSGAPHVAFAHLAIK